MTSVWVQFVLVFAQPTRCSSVCCLRLPDDHGRQPLTEPKQMALPLNHIYLNWGIILAKGQLATIHYDSAPRPQRSCFANSNVTMYLNILKSKNERCEVVPFELSIWYRKSFSLALSLMPIQK